ncbi:T9SS type A sorting domain-containing protein [Hymenobacter glacialis]|uniref:T9SS type A sorting domain-containing protein n=1 Tax=Hymenobacter glacialis TaxID=1908236 RepID=UPI00130105A3|nr:T9SS type A sorting domain-containing protein [Hymenobacter glacialis]
MTGSGNVTAGLNASDSDFSTFAVLRTDANLTLGNPVGLRLKLTGVAPAGYRAGVLLANASGLLSLNALGTVTLRTYLSGATPELREEKVVRADVVRASLLATDRPTQLEFSSSKSFDAVEIEIGGLVGVNYTTNIYYAYGVLPGVQTRAAGYLSQFAAPTSAEYNTRDYTGLACVLTDVDNPERVADFDLTNFATFRSVLTVACQPSLRTKLAGVPASGVPAGHYAGFVVGQAGLLDAGVLSGLRVSTYRNGALQESRTGTGLLELDVLPGGKAQVSFPATLPFDEVGISRTGLLTAVDNLNIYYGFGLQPQFFEGLNPVLTDVTAPTSPEQYLASAPQTISLLGLVVTLSRVVDPENAADGILTNFAQLNTTGLGLITETAKASLRLKLNGTGRAGNRVGVVIQQGAGLLDLAALQRLTLLTYDADKNLIETKTGSALLTVSLLAGSTDKFKVSFLATRDFQYVALEVNSAASVSSNTRLYYGFAEDVPLLSFAAPLPVELSAFTGRWANGAATLNWATASEKNSSHFVVERSTGSNAGFQAIGQVQSVGNSSRAQTYTLRDEEAASQGVAVLYYRLRQVDVDGKQAFSPVVSVVVDQRSSTSRLQVYPNPTSDVRSVMIRLQDLPAGSTVQTYSPLGRLVSRMPVTEAGATRLVLPATLAPGMYYVVLRGASGQVLSTQRLAVESR